VFRRPTLAPDSPVRRWTNLPASRWNAPDHKVPNRKNPQTSATAPPWDDIERLLTDAQLYWIITVRADGRPHAVPLVGVWHEGAFAVFAFGDARGQTTYRF
jgi:hypothetical protein